MRSTSPARVIRLLPMALLVLLGVVAPAPARAGCSHYVFVGNNHYSQKWLAELTLLDLAGAEPVAPQREVPCSGPLCSQMPDSSQLPVPQLLVRTELWCATAVVHLANDPDLSEEFLDPWRLFPQHIGDSIERPPRPSA